MKGKIRRPKKPKIPNFLRSDIRTLGGVKMALVTKIRNEVAIPHEVGHSFTFQALTGSQLDEADRASTRKMMELVSDIDDRILEKMTGDRNADPQTSDAQTGTFDKDILIKYGVVGWTYEEPCDNDNKALLDAKTRDWAADIILKMNKRSAPESNASAGN